MFHAFAFSVIVGATAPTNQAALATKLAEAIANEHGFGTTRVYVGQMPPGKALAAPLPANFTLIGGVVVTPPANGHGVASEWMPFGHVLQRK